MLSKHKVIFIIWLIISFGFQHALCQINSPQEKAVLINERVVINTDRKVYIAGENILYSFYLIDIHAQSLANYPSIGYVVLKNSSGALLGKSQVKIQGGKASGAIYLLDTLKSGYYYLVAYTNFMRNGSPDIFYKSQVLIANRFDKDFFDLVAKQHTDTSDRVSQITPEAQRTKIKIQTNKSVYGKREKVEIGIGLFDAEVNFVDLTVAVVEKNSVEAYNLQRGNSFKRVAKAVYFDVSENGDEPVYFAEDKNAELLGRLLNEGKPIGYRPVYLSSPDTTNNFKYAVSDTKGYFRFPLSDYYNGKDLFIKVKNEEGENLESKIEIDSKFNIEASFNQDYWPVDSSLFSYLKRSQDIVRIQKSFSLIQSQYKPLQYPTSVPLLFKKPDYTVLPVDYVELKDFTEISREIIPALKIRKRDDGFYSEVLDLQRRMFMNSEPLIFLDGVVLDGIRQIIPFGTRDIKKIDLITSEWVIDHQTHEGVLSVQSHNNLWKNIVLEKHNVRLKAENYFETPLVFQPNYSIIDKQVREPDFRQTIYWNPHYRIKRGVSGRIEFHTSDHASSFIIKAVGLTDKGELVEAYGEFEVKESL